MTTYRYYVLQCDACDTPMGWNSDPAHPGRGITICNACWAEPAKLPHHLLTSLDVRHLLPHITKDAS